jgi:hypothetical protein
VIYTNTQSLSYASAYANGKLVAEAELMAQIAKKP